MNFADELARVLPDDLPARARVVAGAARHLELIEHTNRQFNLTRIVTPREAAIKHVLDSLIPWRQFVSARRVLDAGTGAGFPGVPLALLLPQTQFVLVDATAKKARFVEKVAAEIGLENVSVSTARVETLLRTSDCDLIASRAFAPLDRTVKWFAPALNTGARALLYRGPDADAEIAAVQRQAAKLRVAMAVVQRYELPESAGSRTLVQLTGW